MHQGNKIGIIELRELLIKYNDLQNTDEVYAFYYGETNNIRKLYLKDSGFSVVRTNDFILTGVLHKGSGTDSDCSTLFKKLNLQKNARELKLSHIAKDNFLGMLKSDKLLIVLNWLIENNFHAHYFNLNITYWSITDIIDSTIRGLHNPSYIMNHVSLKSDFYRLANSNSGVFLDVLHKFNYLDIPEERVHEFCLWLTDFTCMHSCMLPDLRAHALKSLVKESLKIEELPFISGFHGRKLIDSFMVFRLRNLYLFKNSTYIFDEEDSIQDEVKSFPLAKNGIPIQNHEFIKSHDLETVQLSDVIVGLLGKHFSYLKDVNDEQLATDKSALANKQFKTLSVLKHIIDISDDVSRGFFNEVSSKGEQRRNNHSLYDA